VDYVGFHELLSHPRTCTFGGYSTVSDKGCGDSRLNGRRVHLNEENETRKAKNEVHSAVATGLLLSFRRFVMI
jgi:hypothetical protein